MNHKEVLHARIQLRKAVDTLIKLQDANYPERPNLYDQLVYISMMVKAEGLLDSIIYELRTRTTK